MLRACGCIILGMDFWRAILDFLKLAAKGWFLLAMVSTALLVAVHIVGDATPTLVFSADGRAWTGLVCLCAWAVVVANLLWWCVPRLGGWVKERTAIARGKGFLQKKLSDEQKECLSIFFAEGIRCISYEEGDSIVCELQDRGILEGGDMPAWAWEYLKANLDLLEPQLKEAKEAVASRQPRSMHRDSYS